jgi:hypothetical protein
MNNLNLLGVLNEQARKQTLANGIGGGGASQGKGNSQS